MRIVDRPPTPESDTPELPDDQPVATPSGVTWTDEQHRHIPSAFTPSPHAAPPPETFQPTTTRRFVQIFAVFLCFFLLARTVAVEPFGVPTGSMAPALIGNHREADCPRCGYLLRVGEPGPDARPVKFEACRCPICGEVVDLSQAREVPGDRLMVDKTVYHARNPRRWEVAVFRCPADLSKPYVKRVVGLPGERMQITGGDLYANGELLRKTLSQVRETRILAFDLNTPLPQGWNVRWLMERLNNTAKLPALSRRTPDRTVDDTVLSDHVLHLDTLDKPDGLGLTYRNWNLDSREEEPVNDFLGYNGQPPERRGFGRSFPVPLGDPVHDFSVTFDLDVKAGSGSFACRLSDGADSVRADFPIGVNSPLPDVQVAQDGGRTPATGTGHRLEVGKTYRVEFAFVDRRASLAIDGTEVVPALDLPHDPPGRPRRGGMSRPVQLGAKGVSVVVKNFKLYRDIHYLGVGSATKSWQLGPKEYFMMGDNTSNSHDSRVWTVNDVPTPGVPEKDFIGKPFLIHQPMRLTRILFNDRERVFQTPDWTRMRWMR